MLRTVMLLFPLGVAGVVIGLLALGLAAHAWFRVTRLRSEVAAVRSERERTPPPAPAEPRATAPDLEAIRDVAVVRYDALQEMSGRLSFSLALLNAVGDGVVVSSINGRSETRTYAKIIRDGGPTHPLSPEEERAVRDARALRDGDGSVEANGRTPAAPPSTRR